MKKLLVIKEGQHTDTLMYVKAIKREAEKRNVLVDVINVCILEDLGEVETKKFFNRYNGIIIANPVNKDKEKILFNFMQEVTEKDLDNYTRHAPHFNCTLEAIIELLQERNINIAGQDVVVLGRHLGKRIANYMEKQDATVTVCHSKTRHLKLKTVMADIVICCATPNVKILTPDMVTNHAVIVDVGNNLEGTFKNVISFKEIGRKNIENIFKHMGV